MNILIPVLGFGNSGGYRVLSNIASELVMLGHQVDFLSPNTSAQPYFPTKAGVLWIRENGRLTLVHDQSSAKSNALSMQLQLTKALRQKTIDNYDIIFANHSLTVLPIKKAGLLNKVVYYVQAYEPGFYQQMGGIKNFILAHFSKKSYQYNLFTIVNAAVYLNYKEIKASRVLYPGIDFNFFYPAIAKKDTADAITLGTIGRKEKYKGTTYILDAFSQIKKLYPLAKLRVAFGKQEDFENMAGIECVQPHGDKALAEFYRGLDYYICAGYTQPGAFHYPVSEAMSCGIPVLTTHYYPATTENAWMLEPKNSSSIVSQFKKAHQMHDLREQKQQQGLFDVKQFDWQHVGKKLEQYFIEFSNQYLKQNT